MEGLAEGCQEEGVRRIRRRKGLLGLARVDEECEDKRWRNAGSPSRVYSLIRNLGGLSARD